MPKPTRVNGKWKAQYRRKGLSKTKTFNTQIEAKQWLVDMERQHGLGRGFSAYSLAQVMDRYANEVSVLKKGAKWEITRLNALKRDAIASYHIADITTENLQQWVDKRLEQVTGSTVRREINLLSAVFETARKKWKLHSNKPMADVQRPKENPARDRRISEDEIALVLRALHYEENSPITNQKQQMAVMFLLALESAMRLGEMRNLTWDNVHLDKSYVHLPDTKNGYSRDVPLSRRAKALLAKMESERDEVFSVPESTASSLFAGAVKLTGIKNLTFHDTRHEATTRLAKKVSMLELARITGHRDTRSLLTYYNPTASELAEQLG